MNTPSSTADSKVLAGQNAIATSMIRVAQAFLADSTQRAMGYPVPAPHRCFLATERGRVMFGVTADEGPARDVPPEAVRRFRADLRARRDRSQQQRRAQLALHEQKKQAIAEWVAQHGTPEQRDRQAAGMLPMSEAIEGMSDQAFASLADKPLYGRNGASDLQAHLRQFARYQDAVVTPADLVIVDADAVNATATQWALVTELRARLPEARVRLRTHRLLWKRDRQAPTLTLHGALVELTVSLFTLRREYAVESG